MNLADHIFTVNSVTLLLCSILTWMTAVVVYRLFFHPLAHFPGPKIAAATKWYEFYMDILKGQGENFVWEIERMHKKYGKCRRILSDAHEEWPPIMCLPRSYCSNHSR